MSIEMVCPECGQSHQVNNRLAGRRVRCPSCDAAVRVPEIDVEAVDQELASAIAESESESEHPLAVAVDPPAEQLAVAVAAEPAVASGTAVTNGATGTATGQPAAVMGAPQPPAAMPAMDDDEDAENDVLQRSDLPEEEMDMTPMVDVTFLLLIFFMVTAAFSLQKSIKMPRQTTDAPSTQAVEQDPDELESVEVQIDEFGSFLVLAQDWERETPGKQNLITALREAIAGRKDGVQLAIKVHEAAKLHALVDAMDAGTISGYSELQVTQVDEFN